MVADKGWGVGAGMRNKNFASCLIRHSGGKPAFGISGNLASIRINRNRNVGVMIAVSEQKTMMSNTVCVELAPRRVFQCEDTLCAVEELINLFDAEAIPERLPHVRPQAVSVDGVDIVVLVPGRWRCSKQVPQSFAYIDKPRGSRGTNVIPESGSAEFGRET